MRDNTAFSHLAGREVSTWSEEWRHECEVAAVLAMSPAQRKSFFDGTTEPESGRKERGVTEVRSAAAAEKINDDMNRLDELPRAKKLDTSKNPSGLGGWIVIPCSG
jgi:hypothetical protein